MSDSGILFGAYGAQDVRILVKFVRSIRDCKKGDRRGGEDECADLLGRLLEGLKTSKNRASDLSTPRLPFASKRGRADCKRFAQSAGPVSQMCLLGYLFDVWGPSGSLFGVIVSSWLRLGATLGTFSVSENRLGQQWCAKGRPRAVPTI